MDALKLDLKNLIIDTLSLEDVTTADIGDNDPLFGDGLGLDSIDALEIGVAIKKTYGVELKGEHSQKHFENIATLATFIAEKQAA